MKNKLKLITLLVLALSMTLGLVSCSGEKTSEENIVEESKVYEYEEQSLTELFKLYFDEETTRSLSVETFNTTEGHVVIRYTTTEEMTDYGATMREMFTRYINFCEAAFQVEYLDEVRLFVTAPIADERGNMTEEELFSFWLDEDVYSTFTWENMVEKPVYDLISEYVSYPEYSFGVLDTSGFNPQTELYYMGK